nr:hypothetical protein B0A51_05629 [Rachicladosporium sp. CCFEE 5018]
MHEVLAAQQLLHTMWHSRSGEPYPEENRTKGYVDSSFNIMVRTLPDADCTAWEQLTMMIRPAGVLLLRIDHPSDLYVLDGNPGSWCRFSNINHSCVPNTAYAFPGDVMIIRAQRTIEKDEEITLSYRDLGANFENDSFALNLYFEFTCDCTPCTAERHIAPEVRKRRSKLQSQAPEMPSLFVADKPQTESATVAAIKPMIVLRNCLTATFGIEPTIAEILLMQLKEIMGVRGLEAAAERLGKITTDVHCLHRVDPKGSGLPQLGLHAESMEEALKLLEMNGF